MLKHAATTSLFAVLGVIASAIAGAQNSPQSEPKTLDTVVVTGTLPGPGLWKVTDGDRTLWLLGTVSPLPKNMIWDSAEIEEIVSQADEIIAPGGAVADVGATDVFRMMLLARSAIAATKNADGNELKDVLPEPVYARWAAMKTKYMGDNRKVERSRPMFASQDLYFSAISTAGMTQESIVWNRVVEIAEANDISITQTRIQFPLDIDRKAYRAGIAALAESRINDQECFTRTVDTLEADLDVMKRGANAWATGDLGMLRELNYSEVQPACKRTYDAVMGFQKKPGLTEQASSAWLAAVERALKRNAVTFAVLPMSEMIGADGVLARLKALGYVVVEPNEA